jgi:hypothetical protein
MYSYIHIHTIACIAIKRNEVAGSIARALAWHAQGPGFDLQHFKKKKKRNEVHAIQHGLTLKTLC